MLPLATRLRTLPPEILIEALRRRDAATTGIRDFFDLAEALLTPEAIQRELAQLDRTHLAVLAVASRNAAPGADPARVTYDELVSALAELRGEPLPRTDVARIAAELCDLFLCVADSEGVLPFREVAERFAAWPAEGLPDVAALAAFFPPTPVATNDTVDTRLVDRLAAEHAFGTTAAIAELVTAVDIEPARELGKGGLSLPDSKRLALAMAVPLERVPAHLRIAARAGLVGRSGADWLVADAGSTWLASSTADRWLILVSAWHAALPRDVQDILAAARVPWNGLRAFVRWLYPAAVETLEARIDEFGEDAEYLGIVAGGTPGAAGSLVLLGRLEQARAELAGNLPAEVEKVYLQHDLTIVAPGPLTPAIDARLRTLADVESRELASSYRVNASSIGRALAAGEDAASLTSFLTEISLSGMPQPLRYLIEETAARYGRVRVSAIPSDPGRTQVRSDDAGLLSQIVVDKSLSALSLVAAGPGRLISRFEPKIVFWALSDGRYPVVAEDAAGTIVHLERRRLARQSAPERTDPYPDFVARLRAADEELGETGQAWLTRQIEVAIRERRALTVSVRMPGGAISDYLLEPTAVAGGRMRARDRRADMERTLPLSAIAGISTE
ncbi:helicase-associated domain-containing protein [Rathayibacter sp. YIM 133350]|uniref:helicase-associated domain-containing protein n=1 Tax=Rathayibacter sp. YIM 133350 TaxID=3131992 RepID=UPI00307F2C85